MNWNDGSEDYNKVNDAKSEIARLTLENFNLRAENTSLRGLVELFRIRVDRFLIAFQVNIDGIH